MIFNRPKDVEVAFTNQWWKGVVADEAKLLKWLQKLQQTEIGGYDDYMSFLSLYKVDERTTKVFTNIAEDEKKHSGLIIDLLESIGSKASVIAMPSTYWDDMNGYICDVKSAAAVNYFGEALAAFRFELIEEHPDTPANVRELIQKVLPDEQFHRETLKRIAGDSILELYSTYHFDAVEKLKTNQGK